MYLEALALYATLVKKKKQQTPVLILGAYNPETNKARLERLRDCLRQLGFERASLASDHPNEPRYDADDDAHYTKKSQNLIQNWAQMLVFVYFAHHEGQSVQVELDFTIEHATEKLRRSIAMFESEPTAGTLVRGVCRMQKIDTGSFSNDAELCDQVEGYLMAFLDQILW